MSSSFVLSREREPDEPASRDERGVFVLQGEHRWMLRASPEVTAAAFEDLASVARRVHAELLLLDFGNAVGVFKVRGVGTIEVVSGKWDGTHFESMLADIARISSALPFSAGTAGPLPYDRTLATHDDVLYHAFVYVRHVSSDVAPRHAQLLPALRAILSEPYRRNVRETNRVPVEHLRYVGHDALLAITSGAGPTTVLPRPLPGLPHRLDGHIPRSLPEMRVTVTADTPENRFVKAFLQSVQSVLARMRRVCASQTAFDARIRADCDEVEKRLAPVFAAPLWRDVCDMVHVPASSMVLQRRRGYREVFRHFVQMRMAARHLPLTTAEARALLEAKDIATLYELWTFFAVVRELTTLLGPPRDARTTRASALFVDVPRELCVSWANDVSVAYNATFRLGAATRQSYSVELRPDVTLFLPGGDVHVLDAKFKLAWKDGVAEDGKPRAEPTGEDLYKMHAYRDAIVRARSAWALYPGTESREFLTDDGAGEGSITGIGAIPLRPEAGGGAALRDLLTRLLAAGCASAEKT